MAVAQSSSGGAAIRYVLPVLWMASRLAVVGRMAMRFDTGAESDVLVLSQSTRVTDRRTDRRTDKITTANTALAQLLAR